MPEKPKAKAKAKAFPPLGEGAEQGEADEGKPKLKFVKREIDDNFLSSHRPLCGSYPSGRRKHNFENDDSRIAVFNNIIPF